MWLERSRSQMVRQHDFAEVSPELAAATSSAPVHGFASVGSAPTATPPVPEHEFASLPHDVPNSIYVLLPACSLRAAAASNAAWCRALAG